YHRNMFWIYVPPIILVAALAALAVMLGRKSADFKKMKVAEPHSNVSEQSAGFSGTGWKDRLNSVGRKTLHILERLLDSSRAAFSIWAAKLRARRNGKKIDNIHSEDFSRESDEARIIQEIEKTDEMSENLSERSEDLRYVRSEVVVRSRIPSEPVIVQKKELLPENKVQEAALIYRIAENPKDIEAYREIGDYYMAIGNIKDAKESFKMVLKLRPRDLKAKSGLREIEMKMRLGN
ncbi:MAG TPA: hypothetical protein VK254_00400, partial [Candidatus Bathyarchaeia archaeon]|nr:hypothetical protein [Candidatus Bathyarchaeia archaeon]